MAGLKNLPHRRWEDLRDLWLEHLPQVDFSAQFPEPMLWNLPELRARLHNFSDGAELEYITGARESVFREAIVLSRKFTYCRTVSLEAATGGFPTWAIVAAYDACFYGAKAFCYLLGIASLDRNSKLFLDLFAARPYKSGKIRRQVYDVLVAHRLDERLTHNVLWGIMARLCRTLDLPQNAGSLSKDLRSIKFEQIASLRNSLIYDGGFWLKSDTPEHCDLTLRISNIDLYRALRHPPESPSIAERYFVVASKIQEALVYFFGDIAKLAPSMRSEVVALSNWHCR